MVSVASPVALGADQLRQAEVQDLDPAVAGDEQIGRLDVAVHDAAFVRRGEPAGNLDRIVDHRARRQRPPVHPLAKRLADEQLGDDPGGAVVHADVVDRDDIRVIQAARRASFLFEPALAIGIARECRRQDLDRDLALQLRVARAIDLAHAADAEASEDLESADAIARGRPMEAEAIICPVVSNRISTENPTSSSGSPPWLRHIVRNGSSVPAPTWRCEMRRMITLPAVVAVILLTPASARADAVQDWTAIMLSTIGGQTPFAQARFAAITQLAVFEAVNACTGKYEPYLGTIAAPFGASPEAAAIAAAHRRLEELLSIERGHPRRRADAVAGRHSRRSPKNAGISVGEAAAAAMIAARANDGSAPPQTFLPDTTDPGVWQPTPPAFGPGVFLHWRNVAPFGIQSSDQFRSEPPPALTSGRYRRDYDEVKAVGEVGSTRPTIAATSRASLPPFPRPRCSIWRPCR